MPATSWIATHRRRPEPDLGHELHLRPHRTGFDCVAFVLDVFAQRIVRVITTRPKAVELTAMPLCMALWQRGREATPSFRELIGHADAGSQYTFIPYPEHLGDEDIPPSIAQLPMHTTTP